MTCSSRHLDAPYNLQYYKEGDYNSYVATMGCRTRVMSNINGPEESGSRGNFAFTTINLPKLALEAKGDIKKFYELFDKYIDISHDYLLARLHVIEQKHVYNYPFLMGQGVWMDSDKLKPTDSIKDVLKHASYSIGFCGLAECLVALTGHHHGESAEAQKLGLEIVGHLRERTDDYTQKEHMNWSTFGTPAESTAGQFQRANQKVYGKIKGVTDRPYMTNSSHVPVYYPIKAIDKIRIEAPYHALENAGHTRRRTSRRSRLSCARCTTPTWAISPSTIPSTAIPSAAIRVSSRTSARTAIAGRSSAATWSCRA